MDMPYTTPGVMYGLYVPQVGDDFKNELTAGEHRNSATSMGHRYGTGGIDGITFGTLPGRGYDTTGDGTVDQSTGDKRYMIVTYGPYGNAQRYDNENFVFLVYDPENITSDNLLPFTEDLLTQDYTENQKLFYKHKLFCYAGNQTYGVQQLEYDEKTGDLWLECYDRPSGSEFPGTSRYVIDGSVPLYMDTVEVGQSVTGDAAGFVTQAEAKATAACYTDYEDADSDGDKTEQETGWHMTLKCLCGSGKTLQNDHTAQTYGKTGKACKICGKGSQFSTGLRSLGNDYFYGATSGSTEVNGKTYQWGTASLYRLNRDTYIFEKLTEPARLLMSYTMDAADTYEKDGKVYLKDASGNGHDALVEGTYAAIGQGGKENTALGFCGDQYGSVLDRVAVTAEGMKYINDAVEDTYSYSFWLKNDVEMDRFTPIIGMYRDETLQKGLYDAVFEWRYRTSPTVISHVNTGSPVYETFADGKSYITKPGTSGGDGSTYVIGYWPEPEKAGIGKWTHWVVVKSGSNVVTYQNGVQVNSANRANNTKDDILSAFEIGGYINRNWIDSNVRTRLTGLVDDVRIYAGGLTQSEVTRLYNGGAAESAETGTGAVAASSERTFGSYADHVDTDGDGKCDDCGATVSLTVKWDAGTNGGTIDGKASFSETVKPNSKPTAPGSVPVKTGYTFKGWFTAKSGGSLYSTVTITSSTTFYAQFEANKYTVTWDLGTGQSETTEQTYGEKLVLPKDPERKNAEFLGWFTEKGGGTEVDSNTTYTTDGEATYYAHWEITEVFSVTVPVTLPLVIDENGEVHTGSAEIINGSTGEVVVSSVGISTKNGWQLVPFNTDMAHAKVDAKQLGFKINDSVTTKTGNAETFALTAPWEIAENGRLPIRYDAVVSAVSKAVTEQEVLSVVFVLEWGGE